MNNNVRFTRTKEGYIRAERFAELENVTTRTVNRWFREGRLDAVKEGGIIWIKEGSEVDRSFTGKQAAEKRQ